jgi:hypothetical protein
LENPVCVRERVGGYLKEEHFLEEDTVSAKAIEPMPIQHDTRTSSVAQPALLSFGIPQGPARRWSLPRKVLGWIFLVESS